MPKQKQNDISERAKEHHWICFKFSFFPSRSEVTAICWKQRRERPGRGWSRSQGWPELSAESMPVRYTTIGPLLYTICLILRYFQWTHFTNSNDVYIMDFSLFYRRFGSLQFIFLSCNFLLLNFRVSASVNSCSVWWMDWQQNLKDGQLSFWNVKNIS